jgi:hypothetical protein
MLIGKAGGLGSMALPSRDRHLGLVAQSVERASAHRRVVGSSPSQATMTRDELPYPYVHEKYTDVLKDTLWDSKEMYNTRIQVTGPDPNNEVQCACVVLRSSTGLEHEGRTYYMPVATVKNNYEQVPKWALS